MSSFRLRGTSCSKPTHTMAPPACRKSPPVTLVHCMGSAALFFLHLASVEADGKLFALGPKNASQSLDLPMAQQACAGKGAHLASAEELQRAVQDCSFAVCTRGWLADGTIGTTVCNRTGSKPQSVKVIRVQIEMDPSPGSRYDAFCVKAEGKPCGDPPSFPHTVLHGHTGFEMGDELHYVCAQGYIMSNKDAAFTLLCHTCGEWFGQVQACVKDETEGHIDYEDNFPDDLSISTEEHEHNTKGPEEKEYEPQKSIEDGNKTPFDEDDNHIGMKTMYYEQESKVIYGGENFPIGPIIVNNATKTAKSTASNTDGSWLDGFPVTQEAVEEGDEEEVDKMDGSMAMEDDIHTGQINQFGIRNTKNTDRSNLEKDLVPQFTPTNGIIPVQVTLLPTSIPENVSLIRGSSEDIRYGPTPLMESVTQPLASVTSDTSLNLAILETSTDFHLIDQIPLPEEDGIAFPMPAVTTLAPLDGFSDTSINFEGEAVTHRLGGKVFTTFEPCVGADCSSSDKGRMVAIGITVSCLVLLAVLLAVWCFKKQHQKNSVYKLNGKDYSRHQLQQIEMQKV